MIDLNDVWQPPVHFDLPDIRRRLEALTAKDSPVPIPKGPLPKGGKIPKNMRG